MLQRSIRMAGLALLALMLSACQFTQTPSSEEPPLARIAVKGEWSLHSLTAPNAFDTSQLRYRISLRVTRKNSVLPRLARACWDTTVLPNKICVFAAYKPVI